MPKMYDTTAKKRGRRPAPTMIGYYTAREAAEKLGVDPATLKYRRDSADARMLWEMYGTANVDKMYGYLAESHQIHNGYHYYERKAFNKFVTMYIKQPRVIAARARRLTFPKGSVEMLSQTIRTPKDVETMARYMNTLLKTDGELQCTLFSN